jgi:hypothetical protein
MAQLQLTNIINISVSQSQAGVGDYNTSNLAIFSREEFDEDTFGDLGYKIYLSPKEVGEDFGTDSDTYAMANAIFSQKPNVLAGNGYLVVIPFEDTAAVTAVQHLAFSAVPASGSYELRYGANTTSAIQWDDNAAAVQAALRALTGLSTITVAGDTTAGFDVTFTGVSGAATLLQVVADSLQSSTPVNVTITPTTTTAGTTLSTETLADAITRTEDLVQYFGIVAAEITNQTNMLAAAAVVQALNKIAFFLGRSQADVEVGGKLDLLRSGSFSQSRGLYYGDGASSDALVMMASYAGRALSVNFDGSNTTDTMHLKDLIGVQPDGTMTQTLLTLCQAAGADVYASFQGVAKTFCSGENSFFDQVYNLQWFVGALQVAGFNYLAQSSTKVPQTEQGMDGLKGAYRKVCERASTNQYAAAGEWQSSTTFGNQGDFLANIRQVGYYIFSQPIAKQSQTAREARQAPLVQIAVKEAGAIHSSSVIVYVNA